MYTKVNTIKKIVHYKKNALQNKNYFLSFVPVLFLLHVILLYGCGKKKFGVDLLQAPNATEDPSASFKPNQPKVCAAIQFNPTKIILI